MKTKKSIAIRSAKYIAIFALSSSFFCQSAFAGSVSYKYDTLGRLWQANYGSGLVVTYNYDASGNRTSEITTGSQTSAALNAALMAIISELLLD